jgi:hypothetical protein
LPRYSVPFPRAGSALSQHIECVSEEGEKRERENRKENREIINEKLHNLYIQPNTVTGISARNVRLVVYPACMEKEHAQKILVEKHQWRRYNWGRRSPRYEDDI